jgi:hypothetical protein
MTPGEDQAAETASSWSAQELTVPESVTVPFELSTYTFSASKPGIALHRLRDRALQVTGGRHRRDDRDLVVEPADAFDAHRDVLRLVELVLPVHCPRQRDHASEELWRRSSAG